MIALISLYLIFTIYVYFFRDNLFPELIISFLPYIIIANVIVVIILAILLFKKYNPKNGKLIKLYEVLLIILLCGIEYLYCSEYFPFYNNPDENIRLAEDEGIKVFYANIYYLNYDFESLKQIIQQEDPDIVILVEFSDEHEDAMKDFFKGIYPYMNRNSRSTMLAGDIVFSKIPLENIVNTHKVKAGSRNYSYMQLRGPKFTEKYPNGLDLYVVHTAAPVSYENFNMRNEQIKKLSSDVADIQSQSKNPTLIIGDFNLSPRSYYYKEMIKDWDLANALSFQSPNYTRSLWEHKIFRSHIDQIFISPEVKVSEINIGDLPGSDHRSFIFNVGIN